MEDLAPLLIFVIIVVVNLLKYLAEKGGKQKPTPDQSNGVPPRRTPTAIEDFFEDFVEQAAPKPRKLPDWPEGYERPDYLEEMKPFEQVEIEEEQTAEIIPLPPQQPSAPAAPVWTPEAPDFHPQQKLPAVQAPRKASQAILSGSQGMRMPGMTPFGHSNAAGHIDFQIKGKKNLKTALLGHIVFSSPRAYDFGFENTITHH